MILGIETSTPWGSLALLDEEGFVGEVAFRGPRTMAQRLVPTLEHLLATVDRTVEEVQAIAVSRGPGSFTSVRVGLATAKGLALGLGCPLIGVPTLEALAYPCVGQADFLCALIPAPKRNVYAAVYAGRPPEWTEVVPADLFAIDDLAAQLAHLAAPVRICGEVSPPLRAVLEAAAGSSLRWAPRLLCWPRASAVAELGQRRWQAGDVDDALTLTPLYLRPSEPEERFGQRLCQV
jgi:tRNA threonylcarbamoyladenosine biosynthesis protein TsaB